MNSPRFLGTGISHNVRALIPITLLATAGMPMLGGSWTPINSGLPSTTPGVVTLAIDPTTPSTLYACTRGGDVFKSMDGAASWKPVGGIGGATVIAIDPQKTSTLYAVTGHGILRSADGGASWRDANSGLADIPVSLLPIDPVTSATLYAVTSRGIFKSTNAGGSWSSINSGIPQDASIQTVVLDPISPSTVYAVALSGVIFKSADGGTTWAAINRAGPAYAYANSLAIDPVSPDTIDATSFAAGFGSISKSIDGGKSWNAVRTGISISAYVMSFAIDPTKTYTVYASYSDIGVWGVLKSTDGGHSWNTATVAPSSYDDINSQVVIDPSAPSLIYAGYYDYSTGAGGIMKSIDSGQTWNAADAGLSNFSNIRLLAIDSVTASTVYASAGGTLFKSVDRGASWSNIGGPPLGIYPYKRRAIRSMLMTQPIRTFFMLRVSDSMGALTTVASCSRA